MTPHKTEEEILKAAIAKAVKNGFQYPNLGKTRSIDWVIRYDSVSDKFLYRIIFDHDFAKAFWGGKNVCLSCGEVFTESDVALEGSRVHLYDCKCGSDADPSMDTAYLWHLKQMVISENPLLYISKFL